MTANYRTIISDVSLFSLFFFLTKFELLRPEDQFTAKCLCHSEHILQLLTLVVFILVKQSDLLLAGVCLMFKPILTQICHLERKLYWMS